MYCKSCGKLIDDNSKFCRYCGAKQEIIVEQKNQNSQILNEKTIIKLESFFGITISKKTIALYLIWFLINLIIWLINFRYSADKEYFWPFSKRSEIEDYDITEFIVYTIIPLIIVFIVNLLRTHSNIKTIKKTETFDLSYEPDYLPTIIGSVVGIVTFVIALAGGINTSGSENETRAFLSLISLLFRILATVWSVNLARKLNRNKVGWGWGAFFFPTIALIIIGTKRKLKK